MQKRKKVLFIVAQDKFRDEELLDTKHAIEKAGVKTAIASKKKGKAHGKLGAVVEAEKSIDEIREKYYDAIVFVGGPGSHAYFNDEQAWELARKFYDAGKVVAAICAAPTILANAGLLFGKQVTGLADQAQNLKMRGAEYTGLSVEHDGQIITANGPEAAKEFGETIVWALE